MIVEDALKDASAQFNSVDPHTAGMDARILMQHVLQYDLAQLMLYKKQELSAEQQARWQQLVAQRLAHKPVAKIIGEKDFYGATFKTSEATLDPRPDSETLIEQVLLSYPDRAAPLRILDLGTGTGCLLLTLLRLYPEATGVGVDLSAETLQVTQSNVMLHKLHERTTLVQSDWFTHVDGLFDLIISNPPYIAPPVVPELSRSVRDYEPLQALTDGVDGLSAYCTITAQASQFLKPGGHLIVEIGFDQTEQVSALFEKNGFNAITVQRDLGGNPRVVSGQSLSELII